MQACSTAQLLPGRETVAGLTGMRTKLTPIPSRSLATVSATAAACVVVVLEVIPSGYWMSVMVPSAEAQLPPCTQEVSAWAGAAASSAIAAASAARVILVKEYRMKHFFILYFG